jgi:hypothetical protein
MKTKNKKVLLILMTSATLFSIGCARGTSLKNPESTQDLASVEPTKLFADCSQDNKNLSDLQVSLMNLKDNQNQVNFRYVHLRFNKIPMDFKTQGWDLLVYRWTVNSNGNSQLDTTPLLMHPEKKISATQFAKVIPSNYEGSKGYHVFNFSELNQIGVYANINAETPQSFFNNAYLMIDTADPTGIYKVLRVVFRNSSTGAIAKEIDVLLPPMDANPNTYKVNRSSLLLGLHPLSSMLKQNWKNEEFFGFTKQFCF